MSRGGCPLARNGPAGAIGSIPEERAVPIERELADNAAARLEDRDLHLPVSQVGGTAQGDRPRGGVRPGRPVLRAAVYTDWSRIRSALCRAVRQPPREPIVPGTMDDYAGTPLPRRFGIRAGAVLERRFPAAARTLTEKGGIWIAWPKKASGVATDLTQTEVRAFGLAAGFVDYKICAAVNPLGRADPLPVDAPDDLGGGGCARLESQALLLRREGRVDRQDGPIERADDRQIDRAIGSRPPET